MNNKLVWFRQDLRVADNTALAIASEDPQSALYGLFIATPGQWQLHDMAPQREQFILQHVAALRGALAELNIPLLYIETDSFAGIPLLLASLVKQHGFSHLYANREYGWNEKQRDEAVSAALQQQDCEFHLFHDQAMLPPGLTTATGKPYTVFTPFKKSWLQQWRSLRPSLYQAPDRRRLPALIPSTEIPEVKGVINTAWGIGESCALSRLEAFCEQRIEDYQALRDIPAVDGTSSLSPWLAAGVLSPRQCLQVALQANDGRLSGGQAGIDTWISELIWRDFYIHILDSFPQASKHRPFKEKTESIQWLNDDGAFTAWCEGKTGFPLVDAAMRQLNESGWMHNRLRMVVAMFLSKQLLIDWRRGEQYFMQHLVDGHLASNNGGWQWAASTGTDAVPYFRIFNPVTQSRRFDPQGTFIKRYVPELHKLSEKHIHLPPEPIRLADAPDYPAPIIDLGFARARALAAFKAIQ